MARGCRRQPVRFDPIAPEAPLEADANGRTHRDTTALCQRCCRAAMAAKALEAAETALSGAADSREEWIDRRLVGNIVRRLENFVNNELELYIGSRIHNTVMEKFLGSPCICPHLPDYYPLPTKARAQYRIIENLKGSLHLVKGVQSSDMLAYRGVVLNVATIVDGQGDGLAMSRVLKIRLEILLFATERQASLEATGASQFTLHTRKGRSDVLGEDVIAKVLTWWESETRVSPNWKDIVRLRISRNEEKRHP